LATAWPPKTSSRAAAAMRAGFIFTLHRLAKSGRDGDKPRSSGAD
jgi:hypothetical protein